MKSPAVMANSLLLASRSEAQHDIVVQPLDEVTLTTLQWLDLLDSFDHKDPMGNLSQISLGNETWTPSASLLKEVNYTGEMTGLNKMYDADMSSAVRMLLAETRANVT